MATRVAVLSDTHGMLRPEVVAAVRTCAAVIHAGDFDNPRILEELQNWHRFMRCVGTTIGICRRKFRIH